MIRDDNAHQPGRGADADRAMNDPGCLATAAVRRTELILAARDGGSVVVSVWDPAIVEGLRAVKFGASPAVAMDAATAEDPVGGRLDRG
jgi:hypothetical protein